MSAPAVIVGAGPAGLACVERLAGAGRPCVLIDDNRQAGGQYFRQLPPGYSGDGSSLLRDKARFDRLAAVLKRPEVRYLPSTTVWGAPAPLTLSYSGASGSGRIAASSIVIATGAQDRPFPFTGWTLPGVISAGGCLNLAKGHGLVPSGRVMVVGNGPLVLVVAATLAAAGADLVGVVEAQATKRLAGAVLSGLWAAPGIVATALSYHYRILRSGAWFRSGWMVAEARGTDAIEGICIAPVGGDGQPVRDRAEWHDVDTVVTAYGIIPAPDLARLLGCDIKWDPSLNGLAPVRSRSLETSVEGVYAVGDGAGIGGAEVAMLEGRLVADALLGAPGETAFMHRYLSLDGFRRRLNMAYVPPQPLKAAQPDTIICRCEELTLRELALDARASGGDLDRVKKATRIGMGRCQGRNCLPAASQLLGAAGKSLETLPRVRPPIKPIPLRMLAADADAGPSREPDEALIDTRETP